MDPCAKLNIIGSWCTQKNEMGCHYRTSSYMVSTRKKVVTKLPAKLLGDQSLLYILFKWGLCFHEGSIIILFDMLIDL